MLIWNEQYASGSPVIDQQHRQLFHHLNQLEGLLVQTNPTYKDVVTIIELLDFLEQYIDTHFSYEEQCMESYRCPAHEKNRKAHQEFKETFNRFKILAKKEGFRLQMLLDLNQTINTWIQDHILSVDTELNHCISHQEELRKTLQP